MMSRRHSNFDGTFRRSRGAMRNCAHERRGGYVLILTLALLVLAATLMVAVARAAGDHAMLARQEQAGLQRRWGAVSCRAALLPSADQILVRAELQAHRPVPIHRARLQLGAQTFDVAIGDEQAKTNVNALIQAA